MADIALDGVTKRYSEDVVAVHEMNLEIADSEFLILVGPSGCGKSTTLKMIAGLENLTAGELRIGGQVVNDVAPGDRNLAMVFQNYALYPHLSVRENLAFPLRVAKLSADAIRGKVADAAGTLGLTDLLDRLPAHLSGGQRQRVAMGRAIVRDPSAFLMDEPLSNLDARLRVQMRTEVARLQKRLATTTIYVTHDQTEAMTLGDRVVVMRDGHVQQVGTPRELYDAPVNLFVAGFIGSPTMNFLTGRVEGEHIQTAVGEIPLLPEHRGELRGGSGARDVVVGLRPEYVSEPASDHRITRRLAFTAEVEILEWVGADVFAHLSAPAGLGDPLVARLSTDTLAREGEPLQVCIDTSKVHLFDGASGTRIGGLAT